MRDNQGEVYTYQIYNIIITMTSLSWKLMQEEGTKNNRRKLTKRKSIGEMVKQEGYEGVDKWSIEKDITSTIK